jgi:hypothetical protein
VTRRQRSRPQPAHHGLASPFAHVAENANGQLLVASKLA